MGPVNAGGGSGRCAAQNPWMLVLCVSGVCVCVYVHMHPCARVSSTMQNGLRDLLLLIDYKRTNTV